VVKSYIQELQEKADIPIPSSEPDIDMSVEEENTGPDHGVPFPPIYEGSGEDYEAASNHKQQAADFKSNGQYEEALAEYTNAIRVAPPSALLYANRADVLWKLQRLQAAQRDCDLALAENPDSAKALRIRGKILKELGQYEEALRDLSAAQTIDYDENVVEDLKFCSEQHILHEKVR
jgi:suppressor of tumorigenicity protein 13